MAKELAKQSGILLIIVALFVLISSLKEGTASNIPYLISLIFIILGLLVYIGLNRLLD